MKIENRTTFKMKTESYLELSTSETMQLLVSTEKKITRDKSNENVPHLEITKVVLVQCNIVNNEYQQNSRILCKFVLNISFGQLLEISRTNFMFLCIEIWFTDQILNH